MIFCGRKYSEFARFEAKEVRKLINFLKNIESDQK
jgi:hypothetical protein